MKIMTMSMVVGTDACNAKCPFCVSKMTGTECIPTDGDFLFGRNFKKAKQLALSSGVTTVLITGKGESTLYPKQISACTLALKEFPFIELQTNGIVLEKWRYKDNPKILESWYMNGMTTISLSVVHYLKDRNAEIFGGQHYDIERLVAYLQSFGFLVRINCTMINGYIGSVATVDDMIGWCQEVVVDQLTFRPMTVPPISRNKEVSMWANSHNRKLDYKTQKKIHEYISVNGNKLMTLPHGAEVFAFGDMTVCLSDCLTLAPNTDEIRQLIVYPNGRVAYDWVYDKASTLLPAEK